MSGNILVTQKAMNLAGFVFGAPWFLMVGGFKKDRVSFCLGHILHNHFGYSFPNHSRILPVPFFFGGGWKKKCIPNSSQRFPSLRGFHRLFLMVSFFSGKFLSPWGFCWGEIEVSSQWTLVAGGPLRSLGRRLGEDDLGARRIESSCWNGHLRTYGMIPV